MTPQSVYGAIALAFCSMAAMHAHAARSAEEWAQVAAGEVAQLDLQAIRKFGESQARFEVKISRADSASPAPEDHAPRTVRYMADCDLGTMVLVAVGLYDRSGQFAQTLMVPPGAADPVKPQQGSDEAKWIRRACLF